MKINEKVLICASKCVDALRCLFVKSQINSHFRPVCANATSLSLGEIRRLSAKNEKIRFSFFKDRSVFYSTFPIQEQARRGNWNYELKSVYTIGLLNFTFPDDEFSPQSIYHEVKLKDEADRVFYDKLTLIYIELPSSRRQRPSWRR